ncbi:calcium-binding protein, partial [Methyloglobulus sp.]|uniref:calcium-binding protein n=1 Tax=Methyloglobulus sp. TaxID=2518622 RepID=UPI0032B741BA
WNDALGGVDTVNSSVSFGPLGFGIENLNLTGFAAINGTGNSNNNIINGNSAANVLDGGTGADTMHAGDGSDTYFVDNTGDVVSEFWNDALGGVDTVNSSVSFGPLGFGIENLNLTGIANINGTGNANNNVINGNVGNNVLNGGAGNDTLFGSNGNDVLIGGTGADTMNGGDHNDTYSVDNVGDVVAETFNDALGGVDTVNSSVSFGPLGFGIERLNLTGVANINGTGNANNNVINGNVGNNILIGGAGNDTINGGSGNDLIIGGLGKDTMTGGLGADRFDFNSVAESPSLGAFDIVSGFNWGQGDKIDLVTIDANLLLAGNQAFGLGQLAFNSVTNIFTADVVGGANLSINLVGVQPGFSVALDVIA